MLGDMMEHMDLDAKTDGFMMGKKVIKGIINVNKEIRYRQYMI
jgi:hypothetical protein